MKAPSLAIVLGHHGEDEGPDMEDGGDDSEAALKDAAESAIEAVHAKDAEAFAAAVGAICKLHYEQMEGEEDEGGEEEEP
jgi:hypothetical protein